MLPEVGYPIEPFEWGIPAAQIWCFYLLHDWRYIDFHTCHFVTLSSLKLVINFLTLEESKLTLIVYFYYLWAGHSYFTEFWQDVRSQKTSQTLSVWLKIQELHIGSGTSHFQWFNQQVARAGWVPQLMNTLQRLSL